MIKKLITLFKLGRKIAKSDILKIASKFKKPPFAVTALFQILSISFEKKKRNNLIESIEKFINQEELIDLLKKSNFENCNYKNLSNGIVSIHSGWKI